MRLHLHSEWVGQTPKILLRMRQTGRWQGLGIIGSNPLNIKGAEKPFEEAWVDRLNGLKDHEGPIALLGPDGQLWRLWPRGRKGKDRGETLAAFREGRHQCNDTSTSKEDKGTSFTT